MDPKLIAIYFPQFHNIPENDNWWGKNFTDWELVKKSQPLFPNHNQPRVPLDDDYYNPCNTDTLQKHISLAKEYNVHGFMFYHYWFDGKLMLEKPLDNFLENKELDMPFCLSWANASWTRQWTGNNEILLKQNHYPDKELWKKHFDYLLPFFLDKRAIKIDEKPLFAIYAPNMMKHTGEMFDYWQQLATENGLKGIYFMAMKNYDFANHGFLKEYDALLNFQPRQANTSNKNPHKQKLMSLSYLRLLPEKYQNIIAGIRLRFKSISKIETENIWNHILQYAYHNEYPQYKLNMYESAFFDWDNTARYGNRATIYTEKSAEEKKHFLKNLYIKAKENNSEYIIFNAWNEWSESAYLEPDKKNKFAHLEIIKEIFNGK
jgi:hypothetical protein